MDALVDQRAHEGAARVLTAIDDMLDTLVNRTGVVGGTTMIVRDDSPTGLTPCSHEHDGTVAVDWLDTVLELQMHEVAYRAALGTTSRVLQPTLTEFLR